MRTTRPIRDVKTIEDIRAIEAIPYNEAVPARNVHDLFRATAASVGEHPALTVLRSGDPGDAGARFTHAELLAEITRAANMFHGLGLRPGRGVAAFLAPTLPEFPALILGAQVAGIASSINYLLNRDTIVHLLTASSARVLVIPARHLDEACWTAAQGIREAVPTLDHVLVIGDDTEGTPGFTPLTEALAPHGGDALAFDASSDRSTPCAMFHTGGTTGRPKLVQLTHGNQVHAAFGFAQVYGFDERDTIVNGFPWFHVGGTMSAGLSMLAAGGHMVVPSPYALRPRPVVDRYWEIVEGMGATVVSGVPTSIAAITGTFPEGFDTSAIRLAATGGAILPAAIGARFTAKTGIRLFETYGMTESAAAIAFNPGRGEPLPGSVGFRAPYSETRIARIGSEPVEPCAPGESGIVQVRGPQVFPGYLDPSQNAGTLDAEGWLTTGDIGYLTEDERLVLTGREKDLIVRSGHNIDPGVIEDAANAFPGIAASAAVGMPDQYAGEVPALFVVPEPGAEIDLAALKRHLAEAVPEPPARPRSILVLDALPVTAVGKVFKPELRDRAIVEKVRLETEAICEGDADVTVVVGTDDQKRTVVDIRLTGATSEEAAKLEAALQPLPQVYTLRRR